MQICLNLIKYFIELVSLKFSIYLHIFVQFCAASHIELQSFLPYFVASYVIDLAWSGLEESFMQLQ
jgi:hypothetical protein